MTQAQPVFSETRRNVAGIDIAGHADHYVCGPRRDDGTPDVAHFGTATAELHRMTAWLKERDVASVALESTSVYWIPVADLLEASGIEVVLVDTREVRMVPGRKSDVKDCQWLQRLHSCGLLRGGFRPPENIAAVRTLLREKESLVAMRAQCVLQMQKSCDQMNVRIHHAVSDIDGKTGMDIIGAIAGGQRDPAALAKLRDRRCKQTEAQIAGHLTGIWREEHLFTLGQAYRTLQFIDGRIAEYDGKIASMYKRIADGSGRPPPPPPPAGMKPSAKDRRRAEEKLDLQRIAGFDLTSVPGVGYDTAAVVLGELGADFSRFPTERHFASYIGLGPLAREERGQERAPAEALQEHFEGRPRAENVRQLPVQVQHRTRGILQECGAPVRQEDRGQGDRPPDGPHDLPRRPLRRGLSRQGGRGIRQAPSGKGRPNREVSH